LLNCWIAHPECTTDQLKAALDRGFDCNTRWKRAVIEDGDDYLKENSRSSGAMTWRHVNTPLHRFSMANKLDAVLVLLEHGAQMEILNAMGRTALHEAVDWDRSGVVKLLTENGADTNTVSGPRSEEVDEAVRWWDPGRWWYAGRVPLYAAIYNSNFEVVKMLITAGANYQLASPGGWTILDLALLQRDRSIISLLFQEGAKTSQHDYGEAESPTLKDSARLLLAHVARFPSDDCKKAYSYVVSRPEFVAACGDFSTSRHPLDVFLDLLSRAAQMPNPEDVPGALYCTRCTSFVQHVSSNDERQTEIHPNRLSLTRSSEEGCSLCALFDEALQLGAGSGTAVQPRGGDEASRPVFVSATIGEVDSYMTVYWGDQRQTLSLCLMSGKTAQLVVFPAVTHHH
jgi:ankyrin repeat protein